MPRRPGGPRPETRGTRRFKQQRAQATYEALLAAAAKLFAERGFDATQTPDIAKAAGVSTGAFYRYFDDKRHAFLEAIANYLEVATQDVLDRLNLELFANPDRRVVIGQVLDVLQAHMKKQRDLERVCISKVFHDEDVAALRGAFDKLAVERLAGLIGAVTPRSRIPDPIAAARVVHLAATAAAHDRAGLLAPHGLKISEAAARQAIVEMFYLYFFGEVIDAPKAESTRATRGRSEGTTTGTPRSSKRGG